jgi:hypothetical protein
MPEFIGATLAILFALPVFLLAVATPAANLFSRHQRSGTARPFPRVTQTKAFLADKTSHRRSCGLTCRRVRSCWLLPASTGIPSPTTGFTGWSSTFPPVFMVCLRARREQRCFRQGPRSWRTRLGRWAGEAHSHRPARALICMSFCSMP